MNRLFIILLFITTVTGHSQNKSLNGLRVGSWTLKYDDANGKRAASGEYKIIARDKYEIIQNMDNTACRVKYKKAEPILFFYGPKQGNISVQDGEWSTIDSAGRIIAVESWFEGISQWRKEFNTKGALIKDSYHDFENDTSFYNEYVDNRLFRKTIYTANEKLLPTKFYYPENDLDISNAELIFRTNFLNKQSESQLVILTSKKSLQITSITSRNNALTITGSNKLSYPLKLEPGQSLQLQLTSQPTTFRFIEGDTILISSSDSPKPYLIYCKIGAWHVDGRNIEVLKKLKLSRTKDRFLLIQPMGEYGMVVMYAPSGGHRVYAAKETTRIDLMDYTAGPYKLEVTGCDVVGIIELNITE